MKKRLTLLVILLFCMIVSVSIAAQEGSESSREATTDRRSERRVDGQTQRKIERRQEKHPEATGEMLEKKGEKKKERQDKILGDEAQQSRQEKRPQRKVAADIDASGTVSKEELETYKGRMQAVHEETRAVRKDLEVEQLQGYKDIHSKYDADGDGILNADEWKLGKDEFKTKFGENVAADIELYKVNQGKRDALLGAPEEKLDAPEEETVSEE